MIVCVHIVAPSIFIITQTTPQSPQKQSQCTIVCVHIMAPSVFIITQTTPPKSPKAKPTIVCVHVMLPSVFIITQTTPQMPFFDNNDNKPHSEYGGVCMHFIYDHVTTRVGSLIEGGCKAQQHEFCDQEDWLDAR
mgnify:CR=1 FL=1